MTGRVPFPFKLVEGIPTQLNHLLYEGKVDVSPSSSIEYAMNPGRYQILPGLSITAKNKAMSISLQSAVPIGELNDRTVALTTASATSVVLLRILLELRESVNPNYLLYEQGLEDPSATADAVLTIGDLALQKGPTERYPHHYDLGSLWQEFTGMPFVFALWQVNYRKNIHRELGILQEILLRSKQLGVSDLHALAAESAERFGLQPDLLSAYWGGFSYDLAEGEQKGLMTFYGYAAEIGAIASAPDLHFWEP